MSLAAALEILGYRTQFYCPLTEQGRDWVMGGIDCDALIDWSVAGFIETAVEFWQPTHLIFLTRHDGWRASLSNFGVDQLAPDYMQDLERAIVFIRDHTKIPYVVLDVQANPRWDPLCKFLDKPIPDVDFPHLNKSNFNYRI